MLKMSEDVLRILMFLSPGYIAYRIYRLDAPASSLNTESTIFTSLIFASLSYGVFLAVIALGAPDTNLVFIPTVTLSSVLIGAFWRIKGHGWAHWIAHKVGITNEDNEGTAWEGLFNNPKIIATQVIVQTKDGRIFECDDTRQYSSERYRKMKIYPYYPDKDGGIYFIPTRRKKDLEAEWEDISEIEGQPNWGLRLAYVPKDNIARVEVRLADIKSAKNYP